MERGLLWLPLLAVFGWLTWAGWNEYRKLEAYRHWAAGFPKAKYDICAVLGQNGEDLVWGKPTRRGPIALQQVSLQQIRAVYLKVNGQRVDSSQPPAGQSVVLELVTDAACLEIPFTEVSLAALWAEHLQQQLAMATP